MSPFRAAFYDGAGTVHTRGTNATTLAAGDVEIAPSFTGICGTDLHIVSGHMDARVHTPHVFGHETSGHVTAIGSAVSGVKVGDAVTVFPIVADDTCPTCLQGYGHVCPNLTFLGVDAPGALQSRWAVPAGNVVPLSPVLPMEVGALAEPAAVAMHDVRRAGVVEGDTVLVVGGGPVGVLIALVCQSVGAQVTVAELSEHRRRLIRSFGVDVIDPTVQSTEDVVAALTGGLGVDVAFEVSGAEAGVDTALAALRPRGRLCLVAIHAQRRGLDLHRVFWRELDIVGARLYERKDFDRAIEFLGKHIDIARAFVTRIVPLDDAGAAVGSLGVGGTDLKILVNCQE